MTEDEAKTKWCFHFIASHTDPRQAPSQYEREAGDTSPFRHHCIGSACMAWRTLTRTETRHRDGHVVQPGEVYLRGNATTHEVPDGGYCGLAGQPQ